MTGHKWQRVFKAEHGKLVRGIVCAKCDLIILENSGGWGTINDIYFDSLMDFDDVIVSRIIEE
jgi:hypothetical protein